MQGRAASDARADTLKRLEDERVQGRANLTSPRAQLEYDTQTKRLFADADQHVGQHTDTQWKTWATSVNTNTAAHWAGMLARQPNDPQTIVNGTQAMIDAYVKTAEMHGAQPGDAVWTEARDNGRRDALKTRLDAIAVTDPDGAMKKATQFKDILGTQYDDVANKLRARADKQAGDTLAARAVTQTRTNPPVLPANAPGGSPGVPSVDNVHRAIVMQESGGNPNAPTSIDDARGIGQIIPATFNQYARPGEQIGNPSDNLAVSKRIIADYYQRYNGDAQRVAVAYFSGPGNVAPQGATTPYIRDAADGNGKRTSAYVADVSNRMNGNTGSASSLRAGAYQMVMNDPDASPIVKQHALTTLQHNYAAAQIAADDTVRQRKEADDKAASGYVTQMLTGPAPGIVNQIANDPNLDWRTKEHLTDLAKRQSGEDTVQATQAYGPGFWGIYKRVVAPTGDSDRIGDPSELYRHAGEGGDLTLAGVGKLQEVMQHSQKTVDAHSVEQTKASLMGYAKSKLSFEQDTGPIKIRDPKGEALFSAQFIPKFLAAYENWTKVGNKSPWEFLTQENVDKMIKGMRSKTEMDMERLKATGEGAATNPDAVRGQVPQPPPEVDPTGWATVMRAPPMSQGGKPWPYTNWAAAVNALRADPTPEKMAQFNAVFGSAGYDAKELLGKLEKGANAKPASGSSAAPPGGFNWMTQVGAAAR